MTAEAEECAEVQEEEGGRQTPAISFVCIVLGNVSRARRNRLLGRRVGARDVQSNHSQPGPSLCVPQIIPGLYLGNFIGEWHRCT